MNKKTRISVMVLVTLILLLALTIPGMAKKDEPYRCYVQALVVNDGGVFIWREYYGDLEAYWQDGTLYNYCTGEIPFTEQVAPGKGWWYAAFDDVCTAIGDNAVCEAGVLYSDQTIWGGFTIVIYDPDTEDLLPVDEFSFLLYESDGHFEFYKAYTP